MTSAVNPQLLPAHRWSSSSRSVERLASLSHRFQRRLPFESASGCARPDHLATDDDAIADRRRDQHAHVRQASGSTPHTRPHAARRHVAERRTERVPQLLLRETQSDALQIIFVVGHRASLPRLTRATYRLQPSARGEDTDAAPHEPIARIQQERRCRSISRNSATRRPRGPG